MGEGAHQQGEGALAVVLVQLVANGARLARRRLDNLFVFLFIADADEAGAVDQAPGGRCGEDAGEYGRERAGREGAGEECREAKNHVAEDAAEAVGQRPGDRGGDAAQRRAGKHGADEPDAKALEGLVEALAADQHQRPGDSRQKGDDAGKAEELHEDIGKGRTRITKHVGRCFRCGVGEARVGDVPCR
ncbi:hypothetical protein D9M72_504780 [compost metagenome]